MRNFGNDSFATQQHHHNHYLPSSHHHPPPSVHQLTIPPSPRSPTFVKMEPYHSAKSVGVGTNLKQPSKTHFSPVSSVDPSTHHHHHHQNHHNISGHHNSNNNNCTANNNPNGIPINLSHGQISSAAAATTSMISSLHPTLETGTHTAATIISHLPTAALAAACPTTAIRGPSPAHHQQSPINGLPYHHHSSHSPTLPVAHTALPSEIHSNSTSSMNASNRTSPLSLPPPQINAANSNSPYHHTQYHHVANYNKLHNLNRSTSTTGTAADIFQHSQNNCSPGTTSQNVDVTRTHSDDGRKSPNSDRSNSSSVADSNTTTAARIVSQNVNGTYAITGIPSNQAELQVFRVMQRANLLSYFDKMIENGGDDVQQLCEAGNHEFLEIMALIGMASKPLHVRRLQKALQEWMTQPSLFQSPVLPAGYQHQFGVSHIDRTISHTQFTTTTIAAAPTSSSGANATNGEVGHNSQSQQHHPAPVIPFPHLISHNPISPYPAQNAPLYAQEPPKNSSASTSNDGSCKGDDPPAQQLNYTTNNNNNNNNNGKNMKSHERGSSNSSPILASNTITAGTIVGLDKVYLQRGSPSIPVVISTAQTYNSGQQGLSSCSSSSYTAEHYQNCPSPSGSTSSNSSTVSIKSHHQFYHPSSPHESSPDSPVNSESGRSISNKHEESNSTCTELENASTSSSCSSDQANSIQLWDNSTGTATLRVASRSSSYCGSVSGGGSEPSSPAPPPPLFSKGILISSTSQQTLADSPRSSTESVTNRHNNSVAVTSTTSSQDFSSLQEHEIQKLTETAMNIVRSLPPHVKEPKPSKNIEKSSYEFVRRLAEDDPRRMDEIRRLSAIFGKTGENGKRSNKGNSSSSGLVSPSNKTMSILELAMNEAAAQLCKLIPALLTKRDEMFRLASQVIRESGLPYEVIFASSNLPSSFLSHRANNNIGDGVTTSGGGSSKGKIDDIRNSPAHEERISHEFAAACKKIKLDMPPGIIDLKETSGHSSSRKSNNAEGSVRMSEIHNPLRKSPVRENKISAAASLKRLASGPAEHRKTSEYRRSQS